MDRINILVVEDNQDQSEMLVSDLKKQGLKVFAIANSFSKALVNLKNHNAQIDVVIIDVFLDGNPDGICLADVLQELPEYHKPFMFLTSSTDKKLFERAKRTNPFAYLVKPWNDLELAYSLDKAIEIHHNQHGAFSSEDENAIIGNEYLFIKKGKSLKKIRISDIVYVEVEEKYCNIITPREKFVILISLVKIMELLDSDKFCRTHRNFIVNTDKIVEIVLRDNLILLEGGYKATLSDKYKDITKRIRTLR